MNPEPARRYDLDWIRIAAFGTLILYHVGMFYVTWDWHVKSSRAGEAIEPLMQFFSPWRLTLLFIISGVATRFIADKVSVGAFTKNRMLRLFPPLLLAIFVIVPPQAYYEIVEAVAAMATPIPGAVDNFYVRYFTASGNWCDSDGCLITPTYNHMWFVAYLVFYTLLLIPLMPLLRRAPKALGLLLRGPGFFALPLLFLWLTRMTLFPSHPDTNNIFDDLYQHTVYFAAFLFGFAVAKHDRFFTQCLNVRWLALALAVLSWAAIQIAYALIPDSPEPADWVIALLRGTRSLQAWAAIIAALGFAHRYLKNADGPIRRYFTQAIFPFYLLHQTIIVVAGHYLDPLQLPLAIEASALIGITVLGCWLGYELVRRVGWLRMWFGLGPRTAEIGSRNVENAVRGTI